MREIKFAPHFFVKADKATREITGVFSAFGVLDSMDDIVHPGSMAASFQARKGKILFLWSHQFESSTTAVITDIKEIPRDQVPAEMLSEFPQTTGGAVVTRRYLTSPAGENAYQSALETPIQMSFGYNVEAEDFSNVGNMRVRNLRRLDVLECSDTLWGANPNTAANIAAQKGYKFTGELTTRAGARQSSSDREWLRKQRRQIFEMNLFLMGDRTPTLDDLGAKVRELDRMVRR